MSTQKITEEELNQVQEISNAYSRVTAELGQISIRKKMLQNELDLLSQDESGLYNNHLDLQTKERELFETLKKTYGEGSLDINTGEFTPIQTAE